MWAWEKKERDRKAAVLCLLEVAGWWWLLSSPSQVKCSGGIKNLFQRDTAVLCVERCSVPAVV